MFQLFVNWCHFGDLWFRCRLIFVLEANEIRQEFSELFKRENHVGFVFSHVQTRKIGIHDDFFITSVRAFFNYPLPYIYSD